MGSVAEIRIRSIIAIGNWAISGFILAVTFLTIIGGDPVTNTLAIAWAVFFLGGLIAVLRLPDGRRYLSLVLESVVLFCGFGMVFAKVQDARSDDLLARLTALHSTPAYQTTLSLYEAARTKQKALAERTGVIPGDFTTGARQNDQAETRASADVARLGKDLADQDATVTGGRPVVRGQKASMFDLFGKENADLVSRIIIGILIGGTDLIAIFLWWRPRKSRPTQVTQGTRVRESTVPTGSQADPEPFRRPDPTPVDYYHAATEGMPEGRARGREAVMKILGISEPHARALYKVCAEKGWIVPNNGRTPERRMA
jgi:hypothetical protein